MAGGGLDEGAKTHMVINDCLFVVLRVCGLLG